MSCADAEKHFPSPVIRWRIGGGDGAGTTRCRGPVTQNQSLECSADLLAVCPPWVSFSESDPTYVTPRMPPAACSQQPLPL